MPQLTLTITTEMEALLPPELKAFKTADGKLSIWYGDKVAEETNPQLAQHRDTVIVEKTAIEDKYKALVSTSGKDDVEKARLIAKAEEKARTAISPEDKAIIDAVKTAKSDATPEFITEAVTNFPVVNEKLQNILKSQENAKFFEATGLKNEKAFQKFINDKDANPKLLKHYTETVQEGDKTVNVAYADIKLDDGTTQKVKFADYLAKHADTSAYNFGEQTNNQTWVNAQPNQQTFNQQTQTPQAPNTALSAMEKGFNLASQPKKTDDQK